MARPALLTAFGLLACAVILAAHVSPTDAALFKTDSKGYPTGHSCVMNGVNGRLAVITSQDAVDAFMVAEGLNSDHGE
eukprot:2670698-Rhodomonas_salina.1